MVLVVLSAQFPAPLFLDCLNAIIMSVTERREGREVGGRGRGEGGRGEKWEDEGGERMGGGGRGEKWEDEGGERVGGAGRGEKWEDEGGERVGGAGRREGERGGEDEEGTEVKAKRVNRSRG